MSSSDCEPVSTSVCESSAHHWATWGPPPLATLTHCLGAQRGTGQYFIHCSRSTDLISGLITLGSPPAPVTDCWVHAPLNSAHHYNCSDAAPHRAIGARRRRFTADRGTVTLNRRVVFRAAFRTPRSYRLEAGTRTQEAALMLRRLPVTYPLDLYHSVSVTSGIERLWNYERCVYGTFTGRFHSLSILSGKVICRFIQ